MIAQRAARFALAALSISLSLHAAKQAPIRLSTWYWLNSAPKNEWGRDYQKIRALGFSDVLLVWGLDAAAFSFRIADSREAIRAAHAAGLGSYLFVWHARHNSLDHPAEFEQVDAAGHHLYAFDTFNPEWRHGPWTSYLQILARNYGPEPGFAGYVFDNSFAIGQIGSIDGPSPKPDESYLSYNSVEKKLWGPQLPQPKKGEKWQAWTRARETWWAQWASDTRDSIRAVDNNPAHEIVIEDGANAIDPDTVERAGVDFASVAKSFDSVGAYFAPAYSDGAAAAHLAQSVKEYLRSMQGAAGASKIALSLRLSEGDKEDTPGSAAYPTLEQIEQITSAAISLGIRHIDMYGYRMGIYHLDAAGWQKYRPKPGLNYELTGEIKEKFLCDRKELWTGLRKYFGQLQSAGTR